MAFLFAFSLVLRATLAQSDAAAASSLCPCGYSDSDTGQHFTESIIVYFNETTQIDTSVFNALDYAHRNQKGWNTIFRQGASPANINYDNGNSSSSQGVVDDTDRSLQMLLQGIRFDHLSNGAELRTLRQDMLYGTFRTSMRSARPWVGGSALSMFLRFNDSESIEFDMLNMNDASQARVMQTVNGEYPDNALVTNYSAIQQGTTEPGSARDPWDFLDLRFDWTDQNVSFWIGNNRSRFVTKSERTIPNVPQPLFFSHWSTGDTNYMQGPPVNDSIANIRYVRAFFNSSLMSTADHGSYDERCHQAVACSVDDVSLRGSSPYLAAATLPWKQPDLYQHIRDVAGYVAAAFSFFGVASLLNAFIRRTPWHKVKRIHFSSRKRKTEKLRHSFIQSVPHDISHDGTETPAPGYTSPGAATPLPGYESRLHSPWQSVLSLPTASNTSHDGYTIPRSGSVVQIGRAKASNLDTKAVDVSEQPIEEDDANQNLNGQGDKNRPTGEGDKAAGSWDEKDDIQTLRDEKGGSEAKQEQYIRSVAETVTTTMIPQEPAKNLTKQVRIDYLAGLVAISCIMVTLRHFSLTFWPYVTEGQGPVKHFVADQWLSYILGPYVLTPLWIGPFFVTSCRFLVQRYLKNGTLSDVANKMLLRAPRMLIPCFVFMVLEYFLLSLGLTSRLEWLPSVSYSTWPYVQPQSNFGVFLNEMIELAYIIPNAAPEIINHYCVGVLWTIPVQLQFSFVTLLAAVLIRDVRRPWKRFGFYTLAIVAGWYASSWSACHWLGLLLADLDLTYGWIKYTQRHWWALYPTLFLAVAMVLLSPLALLFNSAVFDWSFMAYENGIHPDPATGRPIISTVPNVWAAYPDYNAPSLAVLTFSVGLQIIVELSTWVQKALSTTAITFLHPHIMTIYLMHGFVFWSLGAFIIVALSSTNVPYWGILLITAVCCYTVILTVAVIISPLIEFATKESTKNIWRWATEEPVPHRPTTAPFNKALVIGRQSDGQSAPASA